MTLQRPVEDVTVALRHLDLAIERWRAAFGQRHSVTVNDSLILSNLFMAGGRMLPRDLAQKMLLGTGSLTAMLDRLQRAGFIERVPNPDDRRSTFIEMTASGEQAMSEARIRLRSAIDTVVPTDLQPAFANSLVEISEVFNSLTRGLRNGRD